MCRQYFNCCGTFSSNRVMTMVRNFEEVGWMLDVIKEVMSDFSG
jgi:hypothetical protein